MAMTNEERNEIIAALKAESTDIASLEVVTSLDGVTSLPVVQGNKLVRAPIPLLAKPATAAAETANAAAETANAAAEKAESAAKIAELYVRTTDEKDIYVRGTINPDTGTIVESTQTGTAVCKQYIGIPENTEIISVWLYMVTPMSGSASIAFYDSEHVFLYSNEIVANSVNVNTFGLTPEVKFLRYQMPAEGIVEMRIDADGWRLVESFDPTVIKDIVSEEQQSREETDDALQEAIDKEVSEREAAVRMLKQELDAEVLDRKSADDAMEAEVRELADDVRKADKELLDRMQGVSDNSNPFTDPFVLVRFAGDGFLEQFNTWLDDLHTVTSVADAQKAGFFRVSLYGSFCEVKNIALSWEVMKFQQIVEGNVYIDGQGKVALNDNRYTILQRRYDGSAWSEWLEEAYETRKTIADDLHTGYSGSDVSLSLYRGQSRLFGNAINAATETLAGVMSAEDKIRQRTLGERIEAVNDAVTAAIAEERTARKAADDALCEAVGSEIAARAAEDTAITARVNALGDKVTTRRVNITDSAGQQMFHFNVTSDGTMQFVSDGGEGFMFKDDTDTVGTTRVSVSAKGGVDILSTHQVKVTSDSGIDLHASKSNINLRADNNIVSLQGKSVQAGTGKASLAMDAGGDVDITADAVECRINDTYHVRTAADGTSAYHFLVEQGQVKLRCSADTNLTVDDVNRRINSVAEDFRFVFKDGTERVVLLSGLIDGMTALERGYDNLIPKSMSVKNPSRLTFGNLVKNRIVAVLQPSTAMQNIIYMSDNLAVKVAPDGSITVLKTGTSEIHVIPTCNTALAKTVQIQVTAPTARLATTRKQFRLTAAGALRLN